jgi:hypothetical protein
MSPVNTFLEVLSEVYSRVVGYLRPVNQWNEGKVEEFKQRRMFRIAQGAPAERVPTAPGARQVPETQGAPRAGLYASAGPRFRGGRESVESQCDGR